MDSPFSFETCIFHTYSCHPQSTIDSSVEFAVDGAAEDAAEDSAEQGVEQAVEQAQNGYWKTMFWEKILPGSTMCISGQRCRGGGGRGAGAERQLEHDVLGEDSSR